MEQLELTKEELDNIGFKKFSSIPDADNPKRDVYKIETLNGYFYYNPSSLLKTYKWYHKTIIGNTANDLHLDITKKPELFVILQSFKCDFNIVF
tara:strand:- start:9 stop:290 length:282 start_codon:yes stop_codon:yes gene_type:complete